MAVPFDSITLYDQRGFLLNKRSLVAGQNVSYARQADGVEIHLLDEKLQRRESTERAAQRDKIETKKEAIQQVDGVWKN
jgi:anti-sigma28 factor (negative regulator of flagellin synthesis)